MGIGKWSALATLDIIGSPGFGYGFRVRDSNNIEAKYGLELADSYNTIFDMRVHRTEWKIWHQMAMGVDNTQPGSLLLVR